MQFVINYVNNYFKTTFHYKWWWSNHTNVVLHKFWDFASWCSQLLFTFGAHLTDMFKIEFQQPVWRCCALRWLSRWNLNITEYNTYVTCIEELCRTDVQCLIFRVIESRIVIRLINVTLVRTSFSWTQLYLFKLKPADIKCVNNRQKWQTCLHNITGLCISRNIINQ